MKKKSPYVDLKCITCGRVWMLDRSQVKITNDWTCPRCVRIFYSKVKGVNES